MLFLLPTLCASLLFAAAALAHGPALSPAELAKREEAHLHARRAFGSCQSHLAKRAADSGQQRRDEFVRRFQGQSQRKERRQEATPTQRQIATGTNTASPFTGIPTCVLTPESVQGPYYLPGELIRSDIREQQPGVPLLLDLQVFDANSCEVLPNVMVDFWHANATGVYGGYSIEGTEGETWLRGLAETNNEGVAQITTIFPGHYDGRAIHIHIMAHIGGQIRTDGDRRTYVGGTNPLVGQLYFDMDLINEVEAVAPYSTNTIRLINNNNDRIFRSASTAVAGYDGLMDVRKLGDDVNDGIIAWISVGIDRGSDHDTGFPNTATGTSASRTTVSAPAATSAGTTLRPSTSADNAQGVGSTVFAGKIVAWGMGAVVAAVILFG